MENPPLNHRALEASRTSRSFNELVRLRHSCRLFLPEPVPMDIITSFKASTSYMPPYNLARQVLSLNKLSKAQASLNAIASTPGSIAQAHGNVMLPRM